MVSHLEAEGPEGPLRIVADRYVIAAGAANSAALLLASGNADHPGGLANSSDQVGRNFMMHNNAHIACMDLDRRNDVVFQKTLQVNDWYHDGGDGLPCEVPRCVVFQTQKDRLLQWLVHQHPVLVPELDL